MADELVRVEIGFEGGQILSWLVTVESADALDRKLGAGGSGPLTLEAPGRHDHARSRPRVVRQAPRSRIPGRLRRLVVALRVGIVGLPNSGKTTLFNALTHAGAQVTAYSEVAQKPNLGMAVIADDRLDRLAEVDRLEEGHAGGDPRRRRAGPRGGSRRAAPG